MDLVANIRSKINTLDEGDYVTGLKHVLLHVETAFRHLERGQRSGDDTAFTDAVYRTNQAFEGSVKEAYRVLAGLDPAKQRPYDIEKYLTEHKVFRPRILAQFTNYRTEWRNPSTHDYKLEFDQSESFLAIVSVAAFASLLVDQISERLSFNKVSAEIKTNQLIETRTRRIEPRDNLFDDVILLLEMFSEDIAIHRGVAFREAQIIGAIHGYIEALMPDAKIQVDTLISPESRLRVDMFVKRGSENVIIEVKRSNARSKNDAMIDKMTRYLQESKSKSGVAYLYADNPGPVHVKKFRNEDSGSEIVVISPAI